MEELNEAESWFQSLQERLCARLEAFEPAARFDKKPWHRAEGGGGIMRMLRQGEVIEKGGVHFSNVFGAMPQALASAMPQQKQGKTFRACGVSVIIHTLNPHAPSAHMNLRHITIEKDDEIKIQKKIQKKTKIWFGGGADLTPMLAPYRTQAHEDSIQFHQRLEKACAPFEQVDYARLKEWCAEYFYLPHRKCERGIGGIFFDDLNSGDWQKDFAFVQAVGEAFLDVYPLLLQKRTQTQWTPTEKHEQAKTRSLYAEFNLLYDRGTQFGLKSGGNIDSILSSLPPLAVWE